MKIVFLDIDGVLNCEVFYKKRAEQIGWQKLLDYPKSEFCPERVSLLNELLEKSGAKIVVSSTWRLGRSIEELQSMFESIGIVGGIIGKTDHISNACRGTEIEQWIRNHPAIIQQEYHIYNKYIILDDDSDMLYNQRNNFFHCDSYSGLTPNIVYKAINYFKGFD